MTSDRTIRLNGWEFDLRATPDGVFLGVPDRTGVHDDWPEVPERLRWAEREFVHVPQLEKVWPTVWKVATGAVAEVEAFFTRHGATFG